MAEVLTELVAKITADATQLKKTLTTTDKQVETWAKKNKNIIKGVGVAFTAFGAIGLKMVANSKALNAQLGAAGIKIGKTAKEMRDLALSVTDVSFPLDSVAKTFELLSRAGVTDKNLAKTAKAFDTLAGATDSSAETVAEILIPAFKTFKKDLPTTSEELDTFTWLTKNTTVNLDDFGSVMQYVAKDGGNLNLSIEDIVAILAILEDRGIKGTTATAVFREAINKTEHGFYDFNTVIGVTQDEVDTYKSKIADSTGITEEYDKQLSTQFTAMDKVKQAFIELTLKASGFLEPLEPILAIMTALGPIMLIFSTEAGISAAKLAIHTVAVLAHYAALSLTGIAIGIATAAQWLWNAAMEANPIGIIILAILALIAAIVLIAENWDTIREKTIEIWDAIVGFLSSVWETITGFFKDSWDKVLNILHWDTIREKTIEIWSKIITFLSGIWDIIVSFFKDNWDKILAILFPVVGLPELIARNWGVITQIVSDIWAGVLSGLQFAWDAMSAIVLGSVNWLIDRVNSVIDLINKIPGVNIGQIGKIEAKTEVPGLQHGGIVSRPTLAMVGEAGPEAIIPLDETGRMGGITINFTEPVFFEREDSMNKFVDMIRKGIQRQDRLRFGGAYSGG